MQGSGRGNPPANGSISGHENTAEGSVRVSDYGAGTGF
jgi:hypothetical protein